MATVVRPTLDCPLDRLLPASATPAVRVTVKTAVLGLAYLLVGQVALVMAESGANVAPVWHQAGIAVAGLTLCGTGLWPGVLIGAFVTSLLGGASGVGAVVVGISVTVESLAAALLLQRLRFRPQLDRLADILVLLAAALVAGLVGSSLAMAGAAAGLAVGPPGVLEGGLAVGWANWAGGDAVSTLVIGAALFTLLTPVADDPIRRRPLESLLVMVAAPTLAFVLFVDVLDLRRIGESVAFPVIPLLVWTAFRIGPRGTSVATLLCAVVAVAATERNLGPFVGTSHEGSIFFVVVFVAVAAVTGAAVAAVVAEREAGSTALRAATAEVGQARDMLEARAGIFARILAYSERISGVLAESTLYDACASGIDAVVPTDRVMLAVRDPASGRYVVRAAIGAGASAGDVVVAGEGPAGRAIAERRLVRVHDSGDGAPAATPATAVQAGSGGGVVGDAVGLPLLRDDVVIGAVSIARSAPGSRFDDLDLEAMALLADEVTLAVSNALLHREVADLAIHDSLTGLHNRRFLDEALPQVLASRARVAIDRRPPLSAILFDLDHFGDFNLQHGHQIGDEVLRAFGRILEARLRGADLVVRFGGEEFIAILPGADRDAAVRIADDVRRALAEAKVSGIDGSDLSVTVSAGVAAIEEGDTTGQDLIRTADLGLLMAKRAGRNVVVAA